MPAGVAAIFAPDRVQVVGMQGAFWLGLPCTSMTGHGNLAARGKLSCHRGFPDGQATQGEWISLGIVERPSPGFTEAGSQGRRGDFVQGHLEFARATIDPASKSFLSDFLYGFAD